MDTEQRDIDSIRPYEANRRRNDKAVEAVAKSIQAFGFRQPIVADDAGVIVVGHTRWKAAKKLGLRKVPVHVAKDLTPEQARAYRPADNKTADEAASGPRALRLPPIPRGLHAAGLGLVLRGEASQGRAGGSSGGGSLSAVAGGEGGRRHYRKRATTWEKRGGSGRRCARSRSISG